MSSENGKFEKTAAGMLSADSFDGLPHDATYNSPEVSKALDFAPIPNVIKQVENDLMKKRESMMSSQYSRSNVSQNMPKRVMTDSRTGTMTNSPLRPDQVKSNHKKLVTRNPSSGSIDPIHSP